MGGHLTSTYWTAITQSPVATALAQINVNCGLPNSMGTHTWDTPTQAADGSLWFIAKPSGGWGNPGGTMFTAAQMNAGVTGVAELPSDPSWFPTPITP